MLGVTFFGIFLTPVFYYVIQWWRPPAEPIAAGRGHLAGRSARASARAAERRLARQRRRNSRLLCVPIVACYNHRRGFPWAESCPNSRFWRVIVPFSALSGAICHGRDLQTKNWPAGLSAGAHGGGGSPGGGRMARPGPAWTRQAQGFRPAGVAMEEQPIAFRLATAPTDRDHFEIYKCTQQQLVTSRFVLLAALRNPAVAQLSVIRHVRQKHDPVVWLQKHLCVHFPGHGELMEVSIAFDDPQEAVTLVQGVVDAYLHEVVNAEIDRRRQRLGELDRAVAEKQAEVRKEREALKKLAAELGTSETGTLLLKQKLVLEDLDSARQELSHVKSEVRRLKSDLASQKALLQNADVFNKLREEVKAEKLATIQAEVKRLEAALATTTADQQGLEREVQQMRKETQTFGHVTADLAMIRADIKSAKTTLAALISERDKVKVENRRPPRIQLYSTGPH